MTAATLVFTGQIAPDAALVGRPAAKQARSARSRLEGALGERGLAFEDLLRLRLFVEDLDELPAIEGAFDSHAGTEHPAVSAIELSANSFEPGVALTLDAVAAPDAREQRCLRPHSVRFGSWVFLGAVTATDPRALFARAQERLREQGARLCDVVKVGGWLTFPMRAYGPLGETRSALVGEAGLLPASAAVQVGRVGKDDERLAFEAIAFVPEERGSDADGEDPGERDEGGRRADNAHSTQEATSRLADFYVDARAAGGYVFTSGEVPDGRGPASAQAREVYERLDSHLAAHGASPASVLQQTVFVRRPRDGMAVAEIAREFYGAQASPPPTVSLCVADFGFNPGCDVEIELVAASDGRLADAR